MPGDEGAGLAARHKAEVFEAVDRQMREGAQVIRGRRRCA
jgi:hypothetical protein